MAGSPIVLPPIRKGSTSVTIRVKLYQSATPNDGMTGLTGASAGMLITVLASTAASGGTLTYSAGSGNIQTIATIGTYAAPSAGNCRFGEISATNFNGVYELQFLDTVYSAGKFIHIQLKATNMAQADYYVPLTEFDPHDVVRGGLTAFPNVASGAAGAILTSGAGTAQLDVTAGRAKSDVAYWNAAAVATPDTAGYPKVTIKNGTGAGEVLIDTGVVTSEFAEDLQNEIFSIASIKVKTDAMIFTAMNFLQIDMRYINGTTIAGTGTRIADAFVTMFNIAAPVFTVANVNQTGDSFDRIGAAGVSLSAIPWNNASWDAEVESEVIDALQARGVTTTRTGYLDNLSAGAVALASTALSTVNWTNTRAGYLDNLNIGGNVSSSDEVTAIQNNTRVGRVVPQVIERPDSGTTLTNIELYLYDAIGNMEAPDSAPTIDLKDQAGNDLSARLDSATMALVSTGKYRAIYTSSTTDDLEQLVWTFSVVEGGATRLYGNQTIIVDTSAVDFSTADRSKLEAVFNKLPSKNYLTGTSNSDGDVQADEATGNFPGSVGSINGVTFPTNFGVLGINVSGHVSRVVLVDTITTYTGNSLQTGDAFARLGAPAGVSVSADLASVKTDTGNLVTRITSTLFTGITSLAQWLGLLAGKQTGDTTARTEVRATGAGSGTYDETTDSQEAIRDRGDTAWITATGFSTHAVSDIWEYVINGSAPFAGQAQYALFNSNYGIGQTYTLLSTVNINVNSVLVDTNELQVDWTNGGRLDNVLDARASQTSVDEVPTNSELALRTLASADYSTSAAVQTVDDLVDDLETRLTATRAGYLDKLNISGNVASSGEVTSIQNNTRVVRVVNSTMERPDAGTLDYRVELLLYDSVGNMEVPDSAPTIELVDQAGDDLSGRLNSATMNLVETGRYRAIYTASAGDDLDQLIWTFSVVEGGVTRKYGNTTLLVDTSAVDFTSADRAKLDTLHDTRLTAGRAANLDNLNATVSSRSSHSAADVWTTGPRTLTSFAFDVTVATNNDKTGYALSSLGVGAIWTSADRQLSAFSFPVTLADGSVTDDKFAVVAEAAGRPTKPLGMMRRVFEWATNKRTRDRDTGNVVLRNSADDGTLETQVQSTTGNVDTQTKGV